ncbi:MAG: stage II sporulation protein D [Syntrophomonadaceae bacterium]|nr:stage II sporulation protein D [Syntrophomonadaceae bacterium]
MTIITAIIIKCKQPDKSEDLYIKLYLSEQHQVIELPLEEYIIGTVAAEMPANFELEALKAQAVCARTYALRKIIENHSYPLNADLSDDIYSCQAYCPYEEFKRRHGDKQDKLWNKVALAVNATRGEVMLYDGKLIDALYHSTCGGCTADAEEVWGNSVPYLKAVKCQYCMQSRFYNSKQNISWNDLRKQLNLKERIYEIKIIPYRPAGRAREVIINGRHFSASSVRHDLDLPSTWWQFKTNSNGIIINSRGYGHGVGMCQYGANGLAISNKSYEQILRKYYTGVSLEKIRL